MVWAIDRSIDRSRRDQLEIKNLLDSRVLLKEPTAKSEGLLPHAAAVSACQCWEGNLMALRDPGSSSASLASVVIAGPT